MQMLLDRYREPEFADALVKLRQTPEFARQLGRHVLQVQAPILKQFGLTPDAEGVQTMKLSVQAGIAQGSIELHGLASEARHLLGLAPLPDASAAEEQRRSCEEVLASVHLAAQRNAICHEDVTDIEMRAAAGAPPAILRTMLAMAEEGAEPLHSRVAASATAPAAAQASSECTAPQSTAWAALLADASNGTSPGSSSSSSSSLAAQSALHAAQSALHDLDLDSLAAQSLYDRSGVLSSLKTAGVERVGQRQAIANALVRHGRRTTCLRSAMSDGVIPAGLRERVPLVVTINVHEHVGFVLLQLRHIREHLPFGHRVLLNAHAAMHAALQPTAAAELCHPETLEKKRHHGSLLQGIMRNLQLALRLWHVECLLVLSSRSWFRRPLALDELHTVDAGTLPLRVSRLGPVALTRSSPVNPYHACSPPGPV